MIVGALGTQGRADVDARGALTVRGDDWTLDWWIGGDDRWHAPAREPAVRQVPLDASPIAETRMRIPGGDAAQRVYGIGGPGDVVIVEVENESPAACIVAFAVRGATTIAVEGSSLVLDGRVAAVLPFPPPRWDVTDIELEPEQCGAQTGPIPPAGFAPGELRAALLYPLSHRNRLRIGIVTGESRPSLDLAQAPDVVRAARGWARHLERGMRVRGPEADVAAIDVARTQLLLDPDPDPAVAAALEDWGFDERAEWAWHGLSVRERRAARHREELARGTGPAAELLRARSRFLRERDDGIDVFCDPPAVGVDLEVYDAPTAHGSLSVALRWHGDRPALLWDLRDGTAETELRAPTLAPGWASRAAVGETLLVRD